MRVLALDTALAACSVAVLDGERELGDERRIVGRGQAELLMPMLARVLGRAGLGIAEMDLLAVTTGPGTFTGIRIGVAAARGLALAAAKPLVGITTFEAIAAALAPPARAGRRSRPQRNVWRAERAGRAIVVAIDARNDTAYVQTFDPRLAPLTAPRALAITQLSTYLPPGPIIVLGSASQAVARALAGGRDVLVADLAVDPDARIVARLALARGLPPADAMPVAPFYLETPNLRSIGGAVAR